MKALDLKGQKDLQDQYTTQSTALESSRGTVYLFILHLLTFYFSDSKLRINNNGEVRARKVAIEKRNGRRGRTQNGKSVE